MAKSRTWFIPTSPRSPHKIKDELELLSRFEDYDWWKREENKLVYQEQFARLLARSDFFEGKVSNTDPAFSARDRCRAIWMFGFAFIDKNGFLKVTSAGKRLIQGIRVDEIFLKQLLKWQFPSWQHGGNPRTRHKYFVEKMDIFPFVETLRIAKEVDGITKRELAIFLLPCLSKRDFREVPSKIAEYRKEVRNKQPGRPRKEFIDSYHFGHFSEVYKGDIDKGDIGTRETPTKTIKEFLRKKIRNSMDYADAITRYFQYTGLFTRSYNRLIITPYRYADVERILEKMIFSIYPYTDVNNFYKYLGDPKKPMLPWENILDMNNQIEQTNNRISKIINELKILDTSFFPPKIPTAPSAEALEALINYNYQLELYYRSLREELFSRDVQRPERVEEIRILYDKIVSRDVIDPSLFFEWNTWRSFIALNDSYTVPNFKMDNELNPLSVASGKKADIEVHFNEDYVVLVEVTLSGGERQYDTESEPVTRHVGSFQSREREKNGKDVYCLFIAPIINPNTYEYFYVYLKHHEWPNAGFLTIIPLSLDAFKSFLDFCIKNQCFNKESFKTLLENIKSLKNTTETSREWANQISEEFNRWKGSNSLAIFT